MGGYVTPHKLRLYSSVVLQGRGSLRPANEVFVNAELSETYTLKHNLATETFYPVFTPNWNTTVYLVSKTSTRLTIGFGTIPSRFTPNRVTARLTTTGGTVSVAADSTTATLTHNLGDATACYFATPTWNTTVYILTKTSNAITWSFGTPPSEAETLYYGRYNLTNSVVLPSETVSASAASTKITHSLDLLMADIFVAPKWNTTVYVDDHLRNPNHATVKYGNSAPSGGSTIDAVAGTADLLA